MQCPFAFLLQSGWPDRGRGLARSHKPRRGSGRLSTDGTGGGLLIMCLRGAEKGMELPGKVTRFKWIERPLASVETVCPSSPNWSFNKNQRSQAENRGWRRVRNGSWYPLVQQPPNLVDKPTSHYLPRTWVRRLGIEVLKLWEI